MFGDIGWAEMMLIGVVALIVIGPQDLPDLFRQLGRFTAKLRQMARDFQRAMDQAASETGVKDVARDVSNLANPKAMGLDAVKSAADKFEKWDPLKNAARPTPPTPPGPTPPPGSIAAPPAPATPAASTLTPVSALSGAAAPAAPATVGPETQALYDKQAARAAIVRETAEKLKAVDQPAASAEAAAKPARAPRRKAEAAAPVAAPPAAASPEEAPAKKPRSPRKKKADSE